MRKFSWILALLAALAMVFIGCGEPGGGGGGPVEDPYVIPVDHKFIQISLRSQNWHTIDIRGGLGFASKDITEFYTEDKAHTISVFGRAVGATNIYFSGAQSSGTGGQSPLTGHTFTALEKGEFKLVREFTWAEISRSNDIRIGGIDAGIAVVNFYEIEIKDEDGTVVYALSTDPDVQSKEHGFAVLTEGGATTTWLIGALGGSTPEAIGKVFDPASVTGPCCTDCAAGCLDCENGVCQGDDKCGTECCLPPFTLDALKALPGITLGVGGDNPPVYDATTKVVTVTASGSTLFYFSWVDAGIGDAWAAAGLKNSVKFTYAAIIEKPVAKVIIKKGTNSTADMAQASYPNISEGPATSITFTKARIGADADGLSFQHNNDTTSNEAVYYVKILSAEIIACPDCEELACVCLPCNCFCAECVEAEECDGLSCAVGCGCTCHFDWTGVEGSFSVAIAVDPTTPNEQFNAGANRAPADVEMDGSNLKVTFTTTGSLNNGSGSIAWIGLTSDQTTRLTNAFANGATVTITVNATSEENINYRACIGDIAAATWNGTNMFIQDVAITELATAKTVTYSTSVPLKHVIIQSRAATEDVVVISAITITITAPTP